MARRSKGFRSKTRGKLSKHVRERGISAVSRVIQDFKLGDRVTIAIDSSIMKGQPHPRYNGRTGIIVEKRRHGYILELRDGSKIKSIISRPEHLRMACK